MKWRVWEGSCASADGEIKHAVDVENVDVHAGVVVVVFVTGCCSAVGVIHINWNNY